MIEIDLSADKWTRVYERFDQNLFHLVQILEKSALGKELIGEATDFALGASKLKILEEIIKIGEHSTTDTSITRHFLKNDPRAVEYEFSSVILINSDLPVLDAVLDLAHELVHYLYKKRFNPYEDGKNVSHFVHLVLEGRGGEISAFMAECQVLREISTGAARERENCESLWNERMGRYSYEAAKKKFYELGKHYLVFQRHFSGQELIHQFPDLKKGRNAIISSLHQVPYPLAAIKEYHEVMARACQNEFLRLEKWKKRSLENGAFVEYIKKMGKSYHDRCNRKDFS